MKPEKTNLERADQAVEETNQENDKKALRKLWRTSAKIFAVCCIVGGIFLIGYSAGWNQQLRMRDALIKDIRSEYGRAIRGQDSIITEQDLYIEKLLDWKSVLFEGTKKEVAEKIRQEKDKRLNQKGD